MWTWTTPAPGHPGNSWCGPCLGAVDGAVGAFQFSLGDLAPGESQTVGVAVVHHGDPTTSQIAIDALESYVAGRDAATLLADEVALWAAFQTNEVMLPAGINSFEETVLRQSASMLRMSEKRSLFVRALFDYDPSRDDDVPSRGLTFSFGDILYVTNASDEEWWQAKRFDHAGNEVSVGIIPSKSRWEQKLRSRDRNVSFSKNNSSSHQRSNSKKRLPFMKGKFLSAPFNF